MKSFKKKLATFSALLAFVTVSCSAVYAVTSTDVLGKTGNMKVDDSLFSTKGLTKVDLTSGKIGDVGQVDWRRFNVGKDERVNFGFSNVSQTILNRVLGGQESKILGQLTNSCTTGSCESNVLSSKVILINPAGVMFGPGSQVDLNSFTVSTFDFNGAKNLKGMTESAINSYKNNTLNNFSPVNKSVLNGLSAEEKERYVVNNNSNGKNVGYIHFDSTYTKAFEDAGIDMSQLNGKTKVTLNGTTFAHFKTDADGNLLSELDNANPNKSVNIVSDNISYTDSQIRTGDNYNYITYNASGKDWRTSNSNVKLITADGVTFGYVQNGYTNGSHTVDKNVSGKENVTRSITMDNAGLGDKEAIHSGNVTIKNYSGANVAKSSNNGVKIKDTYIKGMKLLPSEDNGVVIAAIGEYGNVQIESNNDIDIDHSRLESVNTSAKNANGVTKDTTEQTGGEIYIKADGNTTIKDSLVKSAPMKNATGTAGMVRVTSGDTSKITGSRVISNSHTDIVAGKKIDIDNALISSRNSIDKADAEVFLSAPEEIKIHNGAIKGSNILAYATDADGKMSGNIVVSSDSDSTKYDSGEVINGQDKSLLYASDKISLQGKNTKIDNSSLAYKEIKFYNDGFEGQNNVTVANNSTFTPIVNGKASKDIVLETNGNFTLDNANIQAASVALSIKDDEGKIDSVPYQVKVNAAKANNISVTSTEKDVTVKNNSDVNANENINITSKKGFVNVDNSKINAGNDANITAYKTIAFGTGKNITPSADIQAGHDVNITSTNGDITAEKTDMGDIKYGNRLKFDAKKNNIFTSKDSLKSVNVDYVAGESNRFYTEKDVQFVNSSFKSPNNFVESGKDVILNNLEIKNATTNAKDTKTQIFANGNVTTDNVTNEDLTAKGGVFPQSVSTDRTGKTRTVLDVNKTKLAVTTQTVKDPKNPDNGSITLDVKNANNAQAGLELTAVNVKALDQDPTDGYFEKGYYKQGTPEWDKNIDPKEGPEVTLNATDNEIALADITTDKLNLDPNDTKISDNTNGTPTWVVKDQGGFNLDPNLDYNPDKTGDGFTYDRNYDSTTEVEGGDLTMTDWSEWEPTGREWVDDKGNKHTEYIRTKDGVITEKITTRTDREHEITFDNNGNPSEFKLVYEKQEVTKEPGREIKGQDVKDDPSIVPPGTKPEDFVEYKDETCYKPPVIDPDQDSLIDRVTLPREQVEVSKTSSVKDNTVDQSANVMAAAAKVNLVEDNDNNSTDEDDLED